MGSVNELRKQLEDKSYKGSKVFYTSLTAQHMALLGAIPSPPKVYLDGSLFLTSFYRVVVGAHGPYLEFDKRHLVLPLESDGGRHGKYRAYHPTGFPNVKIYYQMGLVSYADYLPLKFYVDFYVIEMAG